MLLQEDLDLMIQENKNTLEYLNGSSILITGGTGFFGKWLIGLLQEAKKRKIVNSLNLFLLCRPTSIDKLKDLDPSIGICYKNMTELTIWDIPQDFDYVIHMANDQGDPWFSYLHNITGMGTILNFAKLKAKSLLYISSGAVYKPNESPSELTPMDLPPLPDNPKAAYKASKIVCEYILTEWAKMSSLCEMKRIRPYTFYGPHLPLSGYAIGEFVNNAMKGKNVLLKSTQATRSYMYPTDLMKYLLTVLVRGQNGCVYNVGHPYAMNLGLIADEVADIFGVDVDYVATSGYSTYIPNTRNIERDFGLGNTIILDDGLYRWKKWLEAQ